MTLLGQVLEIAASVGAQGVVVHGGSTVGGPAEEGCARWRDALERLEPTVPVFIENTAGRTTLARSVEGFARLWEAVGDMETGVVYDTCHAHAGEGEELVDFVERLLAETGRIDLVHGNDSKDGPASGRDRHQHLGKGTIDPELMLTSMLRADAPIVLETPVEGRAADIAWLRGRLGRVPVRPLA